MESRKPLAFLLILLMVTALLCPCSALAAAKRRVAIMPFSYGAVSSEVGTLDVGKGIVSLMITRLVNDASYSVIEREMLDSILKEQNLSVSDRADPATACKIGKLLSIDAIIVGTVTQFGFENKNINIGAAASAAAGFIPYAGGFGFGGLGVKKGKCKVAVDARLVDINTGEILAAVNGSGESKRSGVSLFGGGGGGGWSGGGGGSGSFDMGSSGFASSIAGEATLAAVDSICNQLVTLASRIPDNQSLAAMNVKGKIADVSGDTVIVNVGKNNGIAVGDNLQVERAYKTVKDPSTGKVLKELSATVGVISVTQVDPDSSTANLVKGSGLRVGDNVRKVTTDVSAIILQAPSTLTGPVAGGGGGHTNQK